MTEILLGTVAIEPNRWGSITPDRHPRTSVAEWLDRIAAAGFDGLELWDGHLVHAAPSARDRLLSSDVPIRIFNSYVGFDDPDDAERRAVAELVATSGARGVKFNVGNDPALEGAYTERLATWLEALPDDVAAICECHDGISIAEAPTVAARILDGAGPSHRAQALVHTHDSVERLAAKFDALGDRITHVHVNLLDFATLSHPRLAEAEDRLGTCVDQLRGYGFDGSWTIEFVAGVLSDDDHPAALLDQAAADLTVLRRLLASG